MSDRFYNSRVQGAVLTAWNWSKVQAEFTWGSSNHLLQGAACLEPRLAEGNASQAPPAGHLRARPRPGGASPALLLALRRCFAPGMAVSVKEAVGTSALGRRL